MVELRLVDFYEFEGNKAVFQTDNCFSIIIEIIKGEERIKSELENEELKFNEGIKQLFRERDLEIDNSGYLIEIFDAKDNFIGDQQILKEMIEDIVSDTEDELNFILS